MEDRLHAMQDQWPVRIVRKSHDRLHPQQFFAMRRAQQIDEHLDRHGIDRAIMDDREGSDIGTVAIDVMVMVTVVIMSDLVRSEEHTSELQSLMRISYAVF